jgi:hypothetical protein
MESTATLIQTVRSRLEAGERLAVRQIVDGDTAIFLAQDYDDALLRTHLDHHPSNVYRVHQPGEFTNLRRLLAQFRSQRRNRPKYLHAVLRGEPPCVTEFRRKGTWEFRAGRFPISSWDAAILEDVSPYHFHWGHTATSAMISAWLAAAGCFCSSKRIDWNRQADDIFTDVMDVLAIAGLIDRRSGEQDEETVTALNYHPVVVAKFSEVALALVQSEATRAEADAILARGLWRHRNEIREIDPTAMAQEFAVAWQQDQSRAAARRGLIGLV